jgi:hypothetical protein
MNNKLWNSIKEGTSFAISFIVVIMVVYGLYLYMSLIWDTIQSITYNSGYASGYDAASKYCINLLNR